MKTTRTRLGTSGEDVPELHNGDQLTQAEFHRRYEAHRGEGKVELVGGVVIMPSPVRGTHATSHSKFDFILNLYQMATPGTETGIDATTILDGRGEPQPDLMLRLLTEYGGQSHYDEDDYLIGAPEWLGEISTSTVAIDMNRKKDAYFKAGVQENVVVCAAEREIHWFHFPSRRELKPNREGIWKSKAFPGLWVDGAALLNRDAIRLKAVAERALPVPNTRNSLRSWNGCARKAHAKPQAAHPIIAA